MFKGLVVLVETVAKVLPFVLWCFVEPCPLGPKGFY